MIEWPSYLFQNLDGEARKTVYSLSVTGHSYPAALIKTLKWEPQQCHISLYYLKSMLGSPYIRSK